MKGRAALLQLAGMIGVEARYTDALGETREVSDDTLLALIGAFGLPSDPVQARRELKQRQQSLPFGLSAAHILRAEDRCPEIALRLPAGCRQLAWRCDSRMAMTRSGHLAVETEPNGKPFFMPLPESLPLGYHCLEIEADGVTARTDLIVAPDALSSARRTRAGRPQLGAELPAVWSAQRPELGDRRLHRPRSTRPNRGKAHRCGARHQPVARAVRRRAPPCQPLFPFEPKPAQLFIHRRHCSARLRRRRYRTRIDWWAMVRSDPLGRPISRADRLWRRRSLQAAGIGSAVSPVSVA